MLDNIFNRKTDDPEQQANIDAMDESVTAVDQEADSIADLEPTETEHTEDTAATEADELADLPEEEKGDFVLVGNETEVEDDMEEPLPEPAWPEAQAADQEVFDHTAFDHEATEQDTESSLVLTPGLTGSQLSFDEKVLEKIVGVTVREMPGVLLADGGGGFFNLKSNKGVDINVDDQDQVSLDLDVVLEYGKSAPEIYERLKVTLHARILQMTGLTLKNINVHVVNILTSEEFAEKQ